MIKRFKESIRIILGVVTCVTWMLLCCTIIVPFVVYIVTGVEYMVIAECLFEYSVTGDMWSHKRVTK